MTQTTHIDLQAGPHNCTYGTTIIERSPSTADLVDPQLIYTSADVAVVCASARDAAEYPGEAEGAIRSLQRAWDDLRRLHDTGQPCLCARDRFAHLVGEVLEAGGRTDDSGVFLMSAGKDKARVAFQPTFVPRAATASTFTADLDPHGNGTISYDDERWTVERITDTHYREALLLAHLSSSRGVATLLELPLPMRRLVGALFYPGSQVTVPGPEGAAPSDCGRWLFDDVHQTFRDFDEQQLAYATELGATWSGSYSSLATCLANASRRG